MSKFRATFKELWKRVTPVTSNKKENSIYYNGANNLYPNEMELAINNSPIASRAVQIFSKYVSGGGVLVNGTTVERKDLPVINRRQNLNIADIYEMAGRSMAYQNGVFLWRGVGLKFEGDEAVIENGKPVIIGKQLEVLDYKKCRISKEDGDENPGKIWYRDWTCEADKKSNAPQWFYPFSNNQAVIYAQLERDYKERYGDEEFDLAEAVKCYRGQVLFVNMTPEYTYPLSPFNSVFNDCDTDYRISLANNTSSRNGFMGKTIVQTQGLEEEEEEDFAKSLQDWLGAEHTNSVFLQNVERTDNLDLALKITQLKPNFDDKLFVETDKRNRRNILGCANNLPSQLIYAEDGSLFSAGSDAITEYKKFYSEQTEDERSAIVRAVKQLGFDYDILPIGYQVPTTTQMSNDTAE